MGISNFAQLTPPWIPVFAYAGIGTPTAATIDASTDKLAWRYIPQTTSPITSISIRLSVTGTPGANSLTLAVYNDAGDYPGTILSADNITSAFTPPTSGDYTGMKTLTSQTADLVVGTSYWIVLETSGGTWDASNLVSLNSLGSGATSYFTDSRARSYNGTNWTSVASRVYIPCMIISHADGVTYDGGVALTLAIGNSATASDIFVDSGSNKVQGIRFKVGARCKLRGVSFSATKTGTPGDLVVAVHSGDSAAAYSVTIDNASVLSNNIHNAIFPNPIDLAASTYIYIIFSQSGTSTSNDWDLRVATLDSTYISAMLSPDMRFVHGTLTGNALSGLTISTSEFPIVVPLIGDLATDISQDCPDASNVLEADTTNGVTGTYHAPDASEVWHTAVFGPASATSGTKVASSITNCSAGNIKNGVTIDDVTGTYSGGGAGRPEMRGGNL